MEKRRLRKEITETSVCQQKILLPQVVTHQSHTCSCSKNHCKLIACPKIALFQVHAVDEWKMRLFVFIASPRVAL